MIYPQRYTSLGELLWDALIQYKSEVAHIEMRRKKESERHTYLEFKQQVVRTVHGLKDRGIGPGDRVAIILPNQRKWLQVATAVFLCGGIVVPLDYKLTAKEQQDLLAHAEPKVLVIEYGLMKKGTSWPVNYIIATDAPAKVDPENWTPWEHFLREGPPITPVPRDREDVATIVYSSGTGGTPKGCMLPHRAYLEQYRSLSDLFPMEPGDRYFSILPTNHAIDFMIGFIAPFSCGATVVHQRTLRPEFITHSMKHCEITHIAVVPMLLESFETALRDKLDALPDWKKTAVDGLSGLNNYLTRKTPNQPLSRRLLKPIHEAFGGRLKMLFCGGAFVDPDRADFFYRLGLPVVIGYGLTEACTVVTANDLKPFRSDTVGRAVDGTRIRIAQPNTTGIGEVQIHGDTIMLGYYKAPELTKNALKDGWLHTGDLGWIDASGHLHLVGRTKNMIVTSGGKNIYPEDIEHAFESIPNEELVVFAQNYIWPQNEWVEEQLIAVIRPHQNANTWKQQLKEHNYRLPEFKRIGGFIEWTEEFPRTASLKIKRQQLAEEIRENGTVENVCPL